MKKNKFFTPKIRKGKKGYPFSLFFSGPSLVASQIKTEEEIFWVKPTPFEVSYQSPFSCTQLKIRSAKQHSPVSKTVFTHFSFFSVDQVLASQVKNEEEIFWVKPNPFEVSYQSPISCTQFKICLVQQDSPVSETVFTLFSLFFGGPSLVASQIKTEEEIFWVKPTPFEVSYQSPFSCTQLKIRSAKQHSPVSKTVFTHFSFFSVDQVLASQVKNEEEIFWVKPNPFEVSYQSPISCTQFKICLVQQDSPVSETVFTLFSLFFGGPSLVASQIKTEEEIFWVKPTPFEVSYQSPFSCTQLKIRSAKQHSPVSKIVFTHFSFFLVDQVLASQIKNEEDIFWVTPTSFKVSHQSPMSYTQFKICLVQQDCPVSKTVFTHFSLFFGGPNLIASQIKTEEEIFWVKLTPFEVSYQSPISCTQFQIHSMQQYSPVSEIVFTIFSLFFGGLSLTILDQVWGRDLTGEAGSTEAQLLVTCHLYTAQDSFSAYRQSSF